MILGMASEKQAQFWANRHRELFAVKMFAAGRDEDLPDYDSRSAGRSTTWKSRSPKFVSGIA